MQYRCHECGLVSSALRHGWPSITAPAHPRLHSADSRMRPSRRGSRCSGDLKRALPPWRNSSPRRVVAPEKRPGALFNQRSVRCDMHSARRSPRRQCPSPPCADPPPGVPEALRLVRNDHSQHPMLRGVARFIRIRIGVDNAAKQSEMSGSHQKLSAVVPISDSFQ